MSRGTSASPVRGDRALGTLYGLAIGDALGMPTQLLSPEQIEASFGRIETFEPASADHPIAAGLPPGSITDDTEQALLLAEALLAGGGELDPLAFARSLIAWEDRMRAKGSLDLLGPSTRAAVTSLLDGASVEESGRTGATNGAAMRVAPVGIVASAQDVSALVDRVVAASAVTHNTGLALAGASAVAAAVSAGIDGQEIDAAISLAIEAAEEGEQRGHWVAGASVAARIRLAVSLADRDEPHGSLVRLRELIGTSLATQESVPVAFGVLALFPDAPWKACLAAANLGGDSDTIGAMAGAIGGACHGLAAFPAEALTTIRTVNALELETLAASLLALRETA